jgi:hypothetical protein
MVRLDIENAMAKQDRLFVAVLGNRKAGKSTTWYELFGQRVRTGKVPHKLELRPGEFVEVFLISGSPEERKKYAGQILAGQRCRIVLCAIQYTPAVERTLKYVFDKGFWVYVQWLNPGYSDRGETLDRLGLVNRILANYGVVSIRSGREVKGRAQEIREFIYGWAAFHDLIYS